MDLTACTEPQCLYKGALYLYLYLYSPYGTYGLYRALVPVQRCTLTLPIPLLPLWAVRPVQSLSACTTVHFTFSYTSTPHMGRMACTEPQCLYNGALYLYLYLYSPYGPYGLYRASVPYKGDLYLYLYLYSPYGPYGLYRASVPVQGFTLPFTLPFVTPRPTTEKLQFNFKTFLTSFAGLKFIYNSHLLDFKLSACSECCTLSSG